MKAFWTFALGILFSSSLALQSSAAPQFSRQRDRGQGRVCLYKDTQYQGTEACFNPGDTVTTLEGMNGEASSIRIYGRASVTVYDDTNFRGHSTVFNSSVADLRQVRLVTKSWNDRIQSLQVDSGNGSYGTYGTYGNPPIYGGQQTNPYPNQQGYPNQQAGDSICVYDHPNYQGRSQCWSAGTTLNDLARQGDWNDKISSIRVFGRTTAVVYRDIGFQGGSFVVDRDIPNLAQVPGQGFRNWDHQISSLQIENGRGYGYGYPGRDDSYPGRDRDRRRERDRDRDRDDDDRDRRWR